MTRKEKLSDNFPAVSTKEWKDRIIADLKGEDFNSRLVWKTNEGFDVMPFYRQEDISELSFTDIAPGREPYMRGSNEKGNKWLVRQNITVTDYKEANRKAHDLLTKGVDSLGFIIKEPASINLSAFTDLLMGINPESAEINFLSEGKAWEIADILHDIIRNSGYDSGKVRCAIEADPLGRLMINGTLCIPLEDGLDYLAELVRRASGMPHMRAIHINASHFTNAGADVVKELAYGLSMGNEYLACLTGRKISPDLAASKIRFSFGTGSNYFFEIAKLRAARLLWYVITGKYNVLSSSARRMEIHSVTADWNMTAYDRYVNLLRTQTEAMSAALGGADSVTVEPFDKYSGTAGDFSERLARNQQLILKEEAFFDKVADPAGGSYYVEMLTSKISEKAWELFIETEEAGGFTEALGKGIIQLKISDSGTKRKKDISQRKEILLGINQFPQYDERRTGSNPGTDNIILKEGKKEVEQLRRFRGAEDIEKLRMEADSSGRRRVVFMLALGNPAMRRARAQFSCNFFACGGYTVIDNPGFNSVEEGVKQAFEAKADILVVCSSDEEYGQYAPEALRLAGKRGIVVVAGNPTSMEELKLKGVEHFIHLKSDLVESLDLFHRLTGIRK